MWGPEEGAALIEAEKGQVGLDDWVQYLVLNAVSSDSIYK